MISYIYIYHKWENLTADRIWILLFNLPFAFHNLIAPKVVFPSTSYHVMAYIMYDIASPVSTSARWSSIWGAMI